MMSREQQTQGQSAGELHRLSALEDYGIMDSAAEQRFDDLARIAAQICGTPVALISFVGKDRQWIKASVGTDLVETPRDIAFCGHTIEQNDIFEVRDAADDPAFATNPLVTGDTAVRFYAGAPLTAADGVKLGTVCVLDHKPRALSDDQRAALAALSRQVMELLTTRKQLAKRREADQRHGFILDSAIDYAIVSMKLDGTVTSWNEGAVRILGWSEEEMCGSPCHRFFTPEDRDAGIPEQEMGSALSKGRGKDERWHLRKDGTRFWANGEMMPLTDDADRPIGFIKFLRDRTEQRLEYERLKAVEDRFNLALDAAGFVGSWDWDIQSNVLSADSRFCTFYSVDPEQGERGLPLADFIAGIHPDDREWVQERIQHCIDVTGEFSEEYRLLSGSGDVRWVMARGRCLYDDAGRPTHFPGVAIDTTDRKLAELGRAEIETRMRLALDAGELGTWESTPELSHLNWDLRARELLGHAPDEPLDYHKSFIRRVHLDDRDHVNAAVGNAVSGEGNLDVTFRTIDADHRLRWVHAVGAVINGTPKRFVGTVRDVTELRAAEEHRTLLANELQHRIKNTMAVVQGIVSQSLRTAATPADARDAISNRLQVLSQAHDLLTQASWTAASIDKIVAGAIRLQGEHTKRIRVKGPDVRLGARAALALAMALHELGTNATKYGALSVSDGYVDLSWSLGRGDEPSFEMVWKECNGPAVTPPAKGGFGTRLMTSLARDLGGSAMIDYASDGVRWCLQSTLAAVTKD